MPSLPARLACVAVMADAPLPTLHVFCAQGDYEAHWIIARDLPDAHALLKEFLLKEWPSEEYQRLYSEDPEPWLWHALADNAVLTMDEGDEEEVSMPASGWIACKGRGHLTWGEIG